MDFFLLCLSPFFTHQDIRWNLSRISFCSFALCMFHTVVPENSYFFQGPISFTNITIIEYEAKIYIGNLHSKCCYCRS